VVADARNNGLQDPIEPEAFVPHTVTGAFDRRLLVRTAGAPLALLESVKREVWSVDRSVALTFPNSLTEAIRQFAYSEPRLVLLILTAFAGIGLLLVALGIFSVVAYTVTRQTHEIGIRMALGASRASVLRKVLGQGLGMVGLGAGVGLVCSLGLSRVLASRLYGVTPTDPVTLAAVLAVIALAGLAACYLPARRATRVEPMVALRQD
jgi:putative ABC transport system permease protein